MACLLVLQGFLLFAKGPRGEALEGAAAAQYNSPRPGPATGKAFPGKGPHLLARAGGVA